MQMGVGGSSTGVEIDAGSAASLGDEVIAQWRRVNQEQRRFSEVLRRFDLVHAYTSDGSLSTAAWLRSRCNMTHAQARQQVTVSRELDSPPETASAFAEGAISYQHAAVIASSSRKLGAEVVAPVESILAELARQVDQFRLGLATQHLEHMVDPDGSLSFFEQQHERRRLDLSRTSDGMHALRGLFDAEGGAVIATGLEALMAAPAPDDRRPYWQRRADAMVEAFQQGAGPAQLTILSELTTLKGRPGSPGGELRDKLMLPARGGQADGLRLRAPGGPPLP